MTPAELGAITGIGGLLVGAFTWIVTTRNAERSFTANEEQAFLGRLQREVEYLAGQLGGARDEIDELRVRLGHALAQLADCVEGKIRRGGDDQ